MDNHVFDMTDPGRIEARRVAAVAAAKAKRLKGARGAVDSEVNRLEGLIADAEDLADTEWSLSGESVAGARETLTKARGVRKADVPEAMEAEAGAIKGSVDAFEALVEKAEGSQLGATFKWLVIGIVLAAFFLWCLMWFRRRVRKLERLQERLAAKVSGTWEPRIASAQERYATWYIDRDDVVALTELAEGSRTEALHKEITGIVDEIYVAILAMGAHVEACKLKGARGSFFNLTPLREALEDIESKFSFETGAINEADLFAPVVDVISATLDQHEAELDGRFKVAINGWKRLKAAAEARYEDAKEAFPHSGLDAITHDCDEHGVSERWYADHPLAGDDEADRALWESVDAARWNDPLSYMDTLSELHQQEGQIVDRVSMVIESLARAASAAADHEGIPSLDEGTRVDPEDDPSVTLNQAHGLEAKLAGLLASAPVDESGTAEIEACSFAIAETYSEAASQTAVAQAAIIGAERSMAQANEAMEGAESALRKAEGLLVQARQVHTNANTRTLAEHIEVGRKLFRGGDQTMNEAERLLASQYHLDARRQSDKGREAYRRAAQRFEAAASEYRRLEKARTSFESLRDAMEGSRSSLHRQMGQYGSHGGSLTQYRAPTVNGQADYAALLHDLETQRSAWKRSVRRARDAHEAEVRRKRREREQREAEERRRRAAERRRRSSYSSSSSSSSSFGGGGFGGSSGSFGGGGFGGSSGGW
jgi:hypothetical protein